MARKLVVEVLGDSKSYERALKKSATATQQFGQAMGTTSPQLSKLSKGMALTGTSSVFLAGAAGGLAVALGTKSVKAASDLNEEIAKSEQIFGDSAKAIREWSTTTAEGLGISQTEALRATGTYGALFKTLGFGATENAKLSRSLVQLAADMTSFNNADPSEVLLALRSGLVGEAEPLRRFGVFLSEARVQQEALSETGKTNIKTLTDQEKAFARYTIIMRDTVSAQGDFARTSGDLAGQQRVLQAQVANLEASLGKVLVPTLTAVVGALNDTISAGEDLATVLGKLADLPPIEIPVKFVRQIVPGGTGAFLRHVVLGRISPVALGITIGKEIVDGMREGAESAARAAPVLTSEITAGIPAGLRARDRREQAAANRKAGQAAIDAITRQASAQKSFSQQIAESEQRAAHLRDLIRADPANAKLQQRLTGELQKQSQLHKDIASASADAARTARDAARTAHEAAVQAAEDRRRRQAELAENRRTARQARQFALLGLTPEGGAPTPGAGSLRTVLGNLEDRVKGTPLDTEATRKKLARIRRLLSGEYGKLGKDVRDAILQMFNDIKGALEGGDKAVQGPLTKTHGLATAQIIKGLGLSPEEADEIQRRLAHFNTAGRALSGSGTRSSPGAFVDDRPIDVHTTVVLDGKKVANSTTRHQQNDRRRNPRQKRGPHRN